MPKPKEGDKVKVVTDENEFLGILMPRPEILEKGFIVIKLESGYNIGIEEKKIKKIELIEEYKRKKETKREIKVKKGLPNVSVISTGGTISSKIDYKTGGVYADYTAEDFVEMYPELEGVANIKAKKIMSIMSEDMDPIRWPEMAKAVKKEFDSGADGVVITHGTDTLHFSNAGLSFLIEKCPGPVIFTAAQRSIDRGSSDAFMNLVCSVVAAAKFDGSGVYNCMHGTTDDEYCILIKGAKVRKMDTARRDAFRPVNALPSAKVFLDGKIEIIDDDHPKRNKEKCVINEKIEEKVAMVYVYPGMDPKVIDFYVKEGYKGIVIAATALGHVPTEAAPNPVIPSIKKAIDKGVHIVIASQTLYGRVHPYVYTNLRKLSVELNCIFVDDMLPETAYAKLGYVLGKVNKFEDVKKMMKDNLRGEITERTLPDNFLY